MTNFHEIGRSIALKSQCVLKYIWLHAYMIFSPLQIQICSFNARNMGMEAINVYIYYTCSVSLLAGFEGYEIHARIIKTCIYALYTALHL